MTETLITDSIIAKEALMQLKNNLVMGNNVHREYKKEFVKKGETVNIRKPVKFVTSDGVTRVNQDVEEASTPFTIDQRKHVSWGFSTQDLTMSIEEYSKRYIQPAMITLANTVDTSLCNLYRRLPAHVGTAGTTPTTWRHFAEASKRLTHGAVPTSDRKLVLDPEAELNAAELLKDLYNPKMVEGGFRNLSIGRLAGFSTFQDQNIRVHQAGTGHGTPLIAGADQNVTYAASTNGGESQTINIDGGTASTTGAFKDGDKFTIAGVFAVNPVSKDILGFLQEFTVIADADTDGAGATALTISPAIIVDGAYQTVSAAPADNAALTVSGNYTANLAYHKNALGLVMCPLEMPDGASFKARESDDGISVRVVKDYDINSDRDVIRLDILYGVKAIYPELGSVLMG